MIALLATIVSTLAFGIGRRDDRRVQKQESALLEEFVNRHRRGVADSKHHTQRIRTRSQVRKGAQKFERMSFLLQRIVFGNRADHLDALGLQFETLTLSWRIDEFAGYRYRAAGLEVAHLGFKILEFGRGDDLKACETGTVADLKKGDPLRVAGGAHPTAQGHYLARGFQREDRPNGLDVDGCGFIGHGSGY